jgi:transposase-like protein
MINCPVIHMEDRVPRSYPPEFRRRVLALVEAGRPIGQIATDLGVSDQTIYGWRRQQLIDSGRLLVLTSGEHGELVAARKRIAELETELAIDRRATELLSDDVTPRWFEAVAVMASEGLPVQTATRVLGVSESGYYAWRARGHQPERCDMRG